MNHFMLPPPGADEKRINFASRYANYVMDCLVNYILTNGGKQENLEVKLFGGWMTESLAEISDANIHFVENYAIAKELRVITKDLGGVHPRKVMFDPLSGIVQVKKLRSLHNDTILLRERHYQQLLKRKQNQSDSIELFHSG